MNNFKLIYKSRLVNKYFTSLERINSVEFNRNYDISDSTLQTELFNEGILSFSPGKYFNLNYSLGQIKRGEIFNSLRNIADVVFMGDSINLPSIRYKFDILNSDNSNIGISGRWLKHFATLNYKNLSERIFMNHHF